MATDFFQQQDRARRRTGWLVALFALAVVLIVAAVYLAVVATLGYAESYGGREGRAGMLGFIWQPELLVGVSGATLLLIGAGSLYKTLALAQGGPAVAALLGGRPIAPGTAVPAQRRLLNVVEEMAIAAGTAVPPVYLLADEPAINAFAAGRRPGDAVIGITQGSLDYLTRDELQGVVAHEFSHILNGDMRLNVRLIGLLHGILLLTVVGRIMLRLAGSSSRSRSSSSNKKGGGGGAALGLLGLALIVIGGVGVFFGKLIKSSVSRQREYLADAAAVQFTRNPTGLAGALKKIGGVDRTSQIANVHAEEASHLFFGDALAGRLTNWFSTHPPLVDRIRRLDPTFDGRFEPVWRLDETSARAAQSARPAASREAARRDRTAAMVPPLPPVMADLALAATAGAAATAPAPRSAAGPALTAEHVGTPDPRSLEQAEALLAALPPRLHEATYDALGAQAVIYALLLDARADLRTEQLDRLARQAERSIVEETARLVPAVDSLAPELRLPLAELTLPALAGLSPPQYARFRKNLDTLMLADRRIDLSEYALRTMMLSHLGRQFEPRRARTRYEKMSAIREPAALLLSVLARRGHTDEATARRAFAAGLAHLGVSADMRPAADCGLAALDAALAKLADAGPKLKQQIVEACLGVIAFDQQAQLAELEILRAVVDALDCPMPPPVVPVAGGAAGGAR